MGSLRRLALPAPTRVRAAEDESPLAVDGLTVESVRESWWIRDRWWEKSGQVDRRYWELILEGGRCVVVFRDSLTGTWYRQSA